MKSNYHIAYLSTFVRTTITLIDPHTTYLYNKGERSYCYFTLYPQILMLVIWTFLLCMFLEKKILKDFPIVISRLIFIPFHCSFPLSGGIITWTNLNQNYSRVFQLMFQLFCLIILQKKISNTFLYLFLRNISSLRNCRQNFFSGNQYLNKLLSLLQGYVSQKFKLF